MGFLHLLCLICIASAVPASAADPPKLEPKIRSKIDLKFRPPKKCQIRPKVGPNGGPESARFGPKSALAAFLGLLDLKNEPPEGPSEKASNFERFWDPLGRPQLGSPLSLAQISAFWQHPEKSAFWALFWLTFGPQIGHYTHVRGGGAGAILGRKRKACKKNTLYFRCPRVCDNDRK